MLVRRVTGIVESLAEAAPRRGWRLEVVHDGETVTRRPPRTVGAAHPAFDRLAVWEHPPAFRALLPSARIAGTDPLVLTDRGEALLESTFDREQLERHVILSRRLGPVRTRAGRHLALVGPWSHNHFHWFLDLLPRLALLPWEAEPATPIVVPATMSALQRESLLMAGVAPQRIVRALRSRAGIIPQVRVDELWFPSMTGRSTGNPPAWVIDWLRERLAPPAPEGRRTRLYVSRADAGSRRVAGEERVVALLAEHGFEPILPGTLALEEQLARFAAAEAVVGAHGAGLVGLFAARDATVVELFSPEYVNGCYYALCDAAGHDYWYLVGEPAPGGDVAVDLDALRRTLEAAGLAGGG